MTALFVVYIICAILLVVYGINCHILTSLFRRRFPGRREEDRRFLETFFGGPVPERVDPAVADRLPTVTTQLPVYNEANVVERLIDAAAAMIYPAGHHEIQVLDDSTDHTRDIVARKVDSLRRQGVRIRHITRPHRMGFKAGALRHGLEETDGELLAIFDADFVPTPDFLLRSVPFLAADPGLGFVQARWGHINPTESLISRFQAVGIDGHFMVEQWARNTNGLFMNFNGTAGIFRRQAIVDAGNWAADTLTEDMDLSYRIQLAGWQCRYLIDLEVPAEIPTDLNAFKSQQFRWAKGSTQTALKLMPQVLRSGARPFAKVQAFLHMTHYAIHPLMLAMAVLAPVLLLRERAFLPGTLFFAFGLLLVMSCSGPSRLYLVARRSLGHSVFRTLLFLPFMVCFGCGLAVNNTRAVAEAVLGVGGEFVRTPKRGTGGRVAYRTGKTRLYSIEIAVGLWCLLGTWLYFGASHYLIGHFMLIYAVGFLFVGSVSWRHGRRRAAA